MVPNFIIDGIVYHVLHIFRKQLFYHQAAEVQTGQRRIGHFDNSWIQLNKLDFAFCCVIKYST